ncbi:MAG: alpha/beta hydrolase [Ruminococcaceae bacterium]|nr:alpha/beta hydrolase [Oscillospiraceae bacterium]
MSFFADKRKKKIFIIVASIVLVIVILIGACAIYLGDYYRADEGAIAVFSPTENITVSTLKNGSVVFEPQDAIAGVVFYPGGKVEHHAYEQLMAELARKGILCVLVKMPFNLAVLDINAADGIQKKYPQIENWYIGGHSLGGSMAASYLEDHTDEYEGLILLGSYSTADLSDTELDVLSIYGSEDKVLNREKYNDNISNLPKDFKEIVIDGGCHSYFGMYGAQDGDGTPSISNSEQILHTAEYIVQMIFDE